MTVQRIRVIDSHTAGEPTRTVIDGFPDLGTGSVSDRRERFRRELDRYRSAVVNEPRGSDPVVGALLIPPADPSCVVGVIFFNNVGFLGMCGHGTIGVVSTLAWLGRIVPGTHRIETPVGIVSATLDGSGDVSVANVPSYRYRRGVTVEAPPFGRFTGDIAWGGNWFFLVQDHGEVLALDRVERLTELTWTIRKALEENGITGSEGAVIDHVELFGPPARPDADSRNFVLCPGKQYDRSPCGTGTSAKIASLHEDGRLKEGQVWRQEGIVGTLFEGWVEREGDAIRPTIRGRAFVNSEATLVLDSEDPFCWGIR
ncbi:MAG: proline racemase family protein [Thermoanaerobaculia bacterium]